MITGERISTNISMRYDEKMQVVKRRAMALSDHLDTFNESEP